MPFLAALLYNVCNSVVSLWINILSDSAYSFIIHVDNETGPDLSRSSCYF